MFYIIGLGLGDAEDITVKGLRIVKKCDRVYLENYTSILTVGKEALVGIHNLKVSRSISFLFLSGKILWTGVDISR